MSEEPNVSGEVMEAAAPVESESPASYNAEEKREDRQVPLDALQAERAERQKLQDELKMIKENMSLMMSQAQRQNQPPPKEDFDGLSDDDVLTVGELKKTLAKKEQQYNMNLQELRMTQRHPDYQDVVVKYLPEILKQNPSLRNTLERTNDYELAYHLAKNSDAYKADHKRSKKNADAERIVQNAERAGSLSSVGQTSPISQARRYSSMSDDDFRKEVNRNLGYF